MVPIALTIAGSDSGGGAGLQADLKTFCCHCVHGASVVTCVTAQNTLTVTEVLPLPVAMVTAQLEAVLSDLAVGAVKTGMLLNHEIIAMVAEYAQWGRLPQLVVDPVMVSRSGAQLIDDQAIATLREKLLPQALVLTPNRYEAELLTGIALTDREAMAAAARQLHQWGPRWVVVKGGGMPGALRGTDVVFDGQTVTYLEAAAVDTPHTHGTGCTLAAAIAAHLARGYDPLGAIRAAKTYLGEALNHALAIGGGSGPVGHFYSLLYDQTGIPH